MPSAALGDSEGFANDKTTAVINSSSHSLLLPQLSPERAGPEPAPAPHVSGRLEHLSGDGMRMHCRMGCPWQEGEQRPVPLTPPDH